MRMFIVLWRSHILGGVQFESEVCPKRQKRVQSPRKEDNLNQDSETTISKELHTHQTQGSESSVIFL